MINEHKYKKRLPNSRTMTKEKFLMEALSNKQFVKFLKDNKCFDRYKHNVTHDSNFYFLQNFYDRLNPNYYIQGAFSWSGSKEEANYWIRINIKWVDLIKIICKIEKK